MRSSALQRFIDLSETAIRAASADRSRYREALPLIFDRLREKVGQSATPEPTRPAVTEWLPRAFDLARQGPQHAAALAACVADLVPTLAWGPRKGAEEPFRSAHANATVIGRNGLEERDDLLIGASLVAPQTLYPDHTHPPEEIYLVLSGGAWRNAATPWTEPGRGGLFHNPPGIVHAMKTSDEPLLAVWYLWMV